MLDLGDWVPYQKGQPVKINVMDRDSLGVKTLVIHRDGHPVEEVTLTGLGLVERTFTTCGDYTAHVVRPDGSASPACQFAICDLHLSLPTGSAPIDKDWTVHFTSENIEIAAVYLYNEADSYGRHPIVLPPEQRRSGKTTIPANLLKKPVTLQVWLIGQHPLGRLKIRQDIQIASQK
ncbi:hypothetical protein EI77_03410 [Prosthecobacter fusiformis]|uniref:Uncharacterized protein n=1 Tax=Prosthecobacter fusiformis TaxID=48464 RepID=A0A4R7RQR7_9BACT|nr:hypothetical protein [Prosthecobacter fusiformis]TDU67208.1 hypothetical protein EI77_03410 [Prosthecobacter fusiformis]